MHTPSLRLPDRVHTESRRHMLQVDMSARELREEDVPNDMDIFSSVGLPSQAESGRDQPFIHLAFHHKAEVLRVVCHRNAERLGVFQR